MINVEAVAEVIATYQKYGWILRRVLLTPHSRDELKKDTTILFGDVPTVESAIDAAWFSRPPTTGAVTWELRYLGDVPFALLEKVDESAAEFDNILNSVECRLRDGITAKKAAA